MEANPAIRTNKCEWPAISNHLTNEKVVPVKERSELLGPPSIKRRAELKVAAGRRRPRHLHRPPALALNAEKTALFAIAFKEGG